MEIVFHLNLLEKTYFFVELTGRAMVRPASSDKWKAPFKIVVTFRRVFRIFLRVFLPCFRGAVWRVWMIFGRRSILLAPVILSDGLNSLLDFMLFVVLLLLSQLILSKLTSCRPRDSSPKWSWPWKIFSQACKNNEEVLFFQPFKLFNCSNRTAATRALWINCVYKKTFKVTSGKEKRHWACAELVIQEFENFHCLCYVTTELTLK